MPDCMYPSSQVMSTVSISLLGESEEALPLATVRGGHVAAVTSGIGASFVMCGNHISRGNPIVC